MSRGGFVARPRAGIARSLLIWAICPSPSNALQEGRGTGATAFVGGTLFPAPDAEPIADGVLIVEGGKIAALGPRASVAVPAGAESVDCKGASVLAGFWNCHVHFTDPRWADAAHQPVETLARELDSMLTSHGFVHVFDTGSDLENTLALRARIERDVPGPSVLTAGTPFCPRDGSPFYVAPMKLPELATPEEATAGVRARLAAGADAIKLFAASPAAPGKLVVMPLPVFTAAAAAAHAEHRPVLAHPTTNAGVETAVAGGVDVILHTAPDGGEEWSDAFVARMRAAGVALVPTLQLWEWELARKDSAPELVDRFLGLACRQLGAFARAGGEVLFGTDVGYMADFDPTEELVLMEQAGLDWRAILAALTTAPTRRFGSAEHGGRLAPGMDADVVVVTGRPDEDVHAFAQVRSSWRSGRRLHPLR